MIIEKKWHLILLRRNQEKKISEKLCSKGIETYFPAAPLKKLIGLEKGNEIISPVFPSHLFVNIQNGTQFNFVKQTKGVVNFFYNLNKPAIISEDDIKAIRLFIKLYRNIRFEKVKINLLNGQDKSTSELSSYAGFADGAGEEVLFLPTIGYYMIGQSVKTSDPKIIHIQNEQEINSNAFLYSEGKKTITLA